MTFLRSNRSPPQPTSSALALVLWLALALLKAFLWEAEKGHVDPSSATYAYAAAARKLGATILRHRPVTATIAQPDGSWRIETPEGEIRADCLVNAAGLWAREVAVLAGVILPLAPVEHHYLVTETIPEIAALAHELPTISESEAGYYSRQEGRCPTQNCSPRAQLLYTHEARSGA